MVYYKLTLDSQLFVNQIYSCHVSHTMHLGNVYFFQSAQMFSIKKQQPYKLH